MFGEIRIATKSIERVYKLYELSELSLDAICKICVSVQIAAYRPVNAKRLD